MNSVTMSLTNVINFFIIAAGIGIVGLSMIQTRRAPIRKDVKKYFMTFMWMIILYITMHLTRQMLDGNPGNAVRVAIRTVTFIEFLASGFMTLMLVTMILFTAVSDLTAKRHVQILIVMLGIHVLLLVISQFNGMYYDFDGNNVYFRGKLYILSNLIPLLMIIQGIGLMIRYKKQFAKRVAVAYWIYLLAPIAAILFAAIFPGIQFVILATVLAAVNMFAVITGDMVEKYEKQKMESSRMETELSMATRIQADMLPNIFPAFPEREEFDIYASMTPAKEVGGDFYDYFLLDEDHLGMVMADVSGKGVPAALFMMASKILIQNYTLIARDPKEALEAANRQICQNNREEMFVTVWLGILEISTGKLTAANAGHEFPVLKMPDGKFELYKDRHGLVIGAMKMTKYREYEIQLEPGSKLFLYTDGVAEATNAQNELFGTDRLLDALNNRQSDTPEQALNSVQDAVEEFVAGAPQFDDLTMLCIHYRGKGGACPAGEKNE